MDCLSLAQSDIINTEDSASQVMIRNPHPQAPPRGNSDLSKTLRKPLLPQKLLELGSQVSFYKKEYIQSTSSIFNIFNCKSFPVFSD